MQINDYTSYMKKAIELAELGRGTTSPNPMVGAIIINNEGKIIAEGYHKKAGEPHAEINAIKSATEDIKGSTMIVTLEPCNHFGRTPPCTEAIISAGIKKVVVGMIDPNPKCAGGGIKRLKDAGLEVEYGLLEDRIKRQNEVFIKYITTGRPFVVLKVAISLDGKISESEGARSSITGQDAQKLVHKLRNEYDAIMVGIGTVLIDDPLLTVRLLDENSIIKNPIRIVADSRARLPLSSKIASTSNEIETILFTTNRAPLNKIKDLELSGIKVVKNESWDGLVDLELMLEDLGSREISSLLVEGGGQLVRSFVNNNLVDKFLFFVAPKLIGKTGVDVISGSLNLIRKLKIERIEMVGEDVLIEAYPDKGK